MTGIEPLETNKDQRLAEDVLSRANTINTRHPEEGLLRRCKRQLRFPFGRHSGADGYKVVHSEEHDVVVVLIIRHF